MNQPTTPNTVEETDLPKRLRIKASMMTMGELIAWGSDTALMLEAANYIEAITDRAQRTPAAPVVAEGWKLVPIMPTHEMVRAACDAIGATNSVRAAIAAAPAHPVAGSPADSRKEIEAQQRAKMDERSAKRRQHAVASADFDLPAPNDAAEPMPASEATDAIPPHDPSERADIAKRFRLLCEKLSLPGYSQCDDAHIYGVMFAGLGSMRRRVEELNAIVAGWNVAAPVPASEAASELLAEYWDLAFAEGKTGKSNGSAANSVLSRLRAHFAAPPAAPTDAKDWQKFTEDSAINFGKVVDVALTNGVYELERRCNQVDWTQVQDWRYSPDAAQSVRDAAQPTIAPEDVRDALEQAAEIADNWDTGAPDGCDIAAAIRALIPQAPGKEDA